MGKISQSYLKDKFLSTKGYKRNSPDVNRPYNVIPSNQITMEGVDFPVMGIDDIGHQQMMYPGNNYTFPGNYVTEFPIKNMGNKRYGQVGLEKRMPWEKPTIQDWNKLIKGEYKPEKDLGKEIERQSRPEGAKPIEEVRITAERPGAYTRAMNAIRPYVAPTGGFLDQVRERMVESTGGEDWYKQPNSVLGAFAGTVTAPLAAPQQGMMYGLTGKVQTPSEALNIQNPVGAFVTDVALDPMTYLGVGASKIPQKVSQAVKPALKGASEYLTTQTPLKNAYKYNPLALKKQDVDILYRWDADVPFTPFQGSTTPSSKYTGKWATTDKSNVLDYMRLRPGSGTMSSVAVPKGLSLLPEDAAKFVGTSSLKDIERIIPENYLTSLQKTRVVENPFDVLKTGNTEDVLNAYKQARQYIKEPTPHWLRGYAKGTYQMGGTMGIPGVNGQVVSSGPQPLTSVKKTRGPITKTKKGDVKTMPTKAVKKILKNIK